MPPSTDARHESPVLRASMVSAQSLPQGADALMCSGNAVVGAALIG
jgi:hypothetical protein